MPTTTRPILTLLFCALICLTPAPSRADGSFSFNFFGLRYERHSASSSPSLKLMIETNSSAALSGTWTANFSDSKLSRNSHHWVSVEIHEGSSKHHSGVMVNSESQFAFLFAGKKSWPGQATVTAPAGSLLFTGKAEGKGLAGDFTFSPDTHFAAQAAQHLQDAPTTMEMFTLAMREMTLEQIAAYAKACPKLSVADIIRLKNAGVTPEYCVEARKARAFSIDDIVRLRNAGVPSEFPAVLRSAGYDFNASALVRLRNAGVSADFARDLKKAGFNYDAEGIARLRNAGVSASLAGAVREAFPNATSEEIVRLRNAGVSGEFLSAMKKADSRLTMDNIVRLRNSGVTPEYVKAWRDAGFDCSAEELVRLRNAGVPADYAAATKVADRKPLSVETLIRLRNRGLSAQEIRELRE